VAGGYAIAMFERIKEFGLFLKCVGWRWFNVFAGAFVTTLWAFYQQITGRPLPMTAFWSLVGACILLAVFLAWREQYQKAKARETEREKATRRCFNHAAQLLKTAQLLLRGSARRVIVFPSFYQAEPYNLESNDEVIQVCDLLTQIGHARPFDGIDGHVLKNEWWDFLQWGHTHPTLHFEKGMAYISGAREWNQKVKGRPRKTFDLQTEVLAEMGGHGE
jgi:uncharacterized membrane protein YeaQ/YmgE (transglycosylase-associated protein family)